MNGQPVTRLAGSGVEVIVLFFVASDCPISNRYIPEIRGLEDKFAGRTLCSGLFYPNVGETSDGVHQHEAAYGPEKHILLDPDNRLVGLTHAKLTPESAILVPERPGLTLFVTVYHGRIDNRYIQFGQARRRRHNTISNERSTMFFSTVLWSNRMDRRVGCGIIGHP